MDRCFIVAPITTPPALAPLYGGDDEHFRHVIECILVPAIELAGYEPVSPIAEGSELIHARIVRHLEECELVLCDLSSANPNVFFELGVRTAVDKPVCLVHDVHLPVLPFDTGTINSLKYDPRTDVWLVPETVEKIAAHIKQTADRSAGRNPMWQAFGLSSRGSMDLADNSSQDDKIDFLIAEMSSLRAERTYADLAGAPPLPASSMQERHLGTVLTYVIGSGEQRRRFDLPQVEWALGMLALDLREPFNEYIKHCIIGGLPVETLAMRLEVPEEELIDAVQAARSALRDRLLREESPS